jgi:hypothetical protein
MMAMEGLPLLDLHLAAWTDPSLRLQDPGPGYDQRHWPLWRIGGSSSRRSPVPGIALRAPLGITEVLEAPERIVPDPGLPGVTTFLADQEPQIRLRQPGGLQE